MGYLVFYYIMVVCKVTRGAMLPFDNLRRRKMQAVCPNKESVIGVFAKYFSKDPGEVERESLSPSSEPLNPIDVVELVIQLEKELGVRIPDEIVDEPRTAAQFIGFLSGVENQASAGSLVLMH